MSAFMDTRVHFRCCFDLSPASKAPVSQADVIATIGSWLLYKNRRWSRELERFPLDKSGTWTPKGAPRIRIETAVTELAAPGADSTFWAARYEHPCAESPFRQWRTDIALSPSDRGGLQFALTTWYWLVPGFIGEEPLTPVPTAPGVVSSVMRSKKWACFSGSQPLICEAITLGAGDGPLLKQRLEDPARACPIIYTSLSPETGLPTLDPERLAKILTGTAAVYAAQHLDLDKELDWFLEKGFRCWGGMVRVYMPGFSCEDPANAKRHRYFTREQIADLGPSKVEDYIVQGVARRARFLTLATVQSVEDVKARQREARLQVLKRESESAPSREHVELLELEVEELRDARAALQSKVNELVEITELQEQYLAETGETLRTVQYDRDFQRGQAETEARRARARESALQAIHRLARLPESLVEVVELMELIYGDRIVFTQEARDSARESSFDDLQVAWSILRHAATTLHGLLFEAAPGGVDLEKEFRARSGHELAMTEGKLTKQHKKLMSQRKVTWDGKTIDVTPHIKFDRKPKYFRVHFAADHERRLIVVGHCGDHLDTAGTRRKR
jgi:hypothetical protein